MTEDPWQDLENLLKIPENKDSTGTPQLEPSKKETGEDIDSDVDTANSDDSD